jgi:molybdate transport system regulatory protein
MVKNVNANKMTEIKLIINVNLNNQQFISPERIFLLRKIQQTGSLNAASKQLSISYQNAWTVIEDMNKKAPNPLVLKQRGSGGGGAVISDYGSFILKEYSFIEQQVLKFTEQLNTEINL